MTPLVLLAAVGLCVSAWFKARTTTRLGMGLSPLVILEAITALVLVGTRLAGPFAGTTFARWSVSIAIVVMLAATIDHARRLKDRRYRRVSTEGGRLVAYVKYQRPGTGEGAPNPEDRPDVLEGSDEGAHLDL